MQSVESIQRQAARFVLQRYQRKDSVTAMLKELEWKSLEWRRNAASLAMLYKIQHNMVAINPSDYLAPMITSNTRNYHPNKLKTITSRTQLYGNSFFPRTVYLWNSLPVVVLTAPTLEVFRGGVSSSL